LFQPLLRGPLSRGSEKSASYIVSSSLILRNHLKKETDFPMMELKIGSDLKK
jgi:hypothetical protein